MNARGGCTRVSQNNTTEPGTVSVTPARPRTALLPVVFLALVAISLFAPAASALTLDDYFAAAMARSEVVATQAELIRQAEERYRQAESARLPTVSGVGAYGWQDPVPAGQQTTSSTPNRQRLAKVMATQPLFRGFREFAALRQTQALIGAQTFDYRHARVQLFQDVSENFYTVLTLAEQIEQNRKRERELNERVRIGRSRIGEVLSVQSAISTLRAQTEQLRGQLHAAREVFAFLSGLDAATALRDTEALPSVLEPLDEYLARLALRPDVQAAEARTTAALENVEVARGARLPSLDLTTNRYLERTGSLQDSSWDVQIALNIPLYSGGLYQSRVREAESLRTQAELGVSRARRLAEQEIRSVYQSVDFDRAQLEALTTATETARKNYETQQRDYRLGLVTNLDVLQALTAYQENLRALDRARFAAKLDYLRLQAAAARRPSIPETITP
jgi:outer membrane protein